MSEALRQQLQASLAVTHSRHAWRCPQSLKDLSKPAQWIEPLRNRDEAISEAKRIAEESAFRTGFAWCHGTRWYAADFRAWDDCGFGNGGIVERITIECPGQ
jgi:hypothetical protein